MKGVIRKIIAALAVVVVVAAVLLLLRTIGLTAMANLCA